jgi:uncharacterized membrane protein required for colicin V production
MLMNDLRQLNWLDVFALLLIFRICYVSVRAGFPTELFKFLGTVAALIISLHFFASLAGLITEKLTVAIKVPAGLLNVTTFTLLAASGYIFFVFLRRMVNNLLKIEAVSTFNKWGGLFLGCIRALLLSSLVLFGMALSDIPYLKQSVKNSFFGARLVTVASDNYNFLWRGVFSKFEDSGRSNAAAEIKKEIAGR